MQQLQQGIFEEGVRDSFARLHKGARAIEYNICEPGACVSTGDTDWDMFKAGKWRIRV